MTCNSLYLDNFTVRLLNFLLNFALISLKIDLESPSLDMISAVPLYISVAREIAEFLTLSCRFGMI